MPTSKEIVPNRPLAGHELKQIMMKDFDNMLSGDGMFSGHIAYRRVAYSIEIRLHVDNPSYPQHVNKRFSKDPPKNAGEIMSAIQAPPLKSPGPDASVAALKRERKIESPNVARLESGLPVTVSVVNRQTGQVEDKNVQYGKEGLPPPEILDTDTSDQAADDWGVK